MPVKDNREYRNNLGLFKSLKEQKRFETDYYVEGYALLFNKPYLLGEMDGVKYYEIIDRNALNEADLSDVKMQFDHEGTVLAKPKNNTLGFEIDNKGFFIYADLSKCVEARNLYESIDNKLIDEMSWAFTVSEESYNKETKTRTIKKVKKVYDVSAVSRAANPDTEISARSYLNGVIEVEKQELLERRRKKMKLRLLIGG